jgi:hypothetical protein
MRHQDDYSIRDNYIDNAEHFGHTSGPDFEYARRVTGRDSAFGDDVKNGEHEFWEERHLGDERKKWAEDNRNPQAQTGTWRMVKGRTIRTKRLNQARSRKKS